MQIQANVIIVNGYRINKKYIGKGSGGYVYPTMDGEHAIKIINYSSQKDLLKIKNQINLQSLFKSNYITRIVDHFQKNDTNQYFIIFQRCKQDLSCFWKQFMRQPMQAKQNQISIILSHILMGLYQLHYKKNIIHRDIKAENILVKSVKEKIIYQITDFGISKRLKYAEDASTFCGTQKFLPPQIINKINYNKAADVWQLGNLIYCLFFSANTLNKNIIMDLNFENLKQFPHKKQIAKISVSLREMMQKMLRSNYKQRITVNELINHKHWSKYQNNSKFKEFFEFCKQIKFSSQICSFLTDFKYISTDSIESILKGSYAQYQAYRLKQQFPEWLLVLRGWYINKCTQLLYLREVIQLLKVIQIDLNSRFIFQFKILVQNYIIYVFESMLKSIFDQEYIIATFQINNYKQFAKVKVVKYFIWFIKDRIYVSQHLIDRYYEELNTTRQILNPKEISLGISIKIKETLQFIDSLLAKFQNDYYKYLNLKRVMVCFLIAFNFEKILTQKQMIKLFNFTWIPKLNKFIFERKLSQLDKIISKIIVLQ